MPKLKRFLLRYDPPGVGLEVEEDGGEIEVRHKTLSPNEEVKSESDIIALVEDLLSSEPGLLYVKKHRSPLLGLLGRLYQIDLESQAKKETSLPDIPGRETVRDTDTPESSGNPPAHEGSQHDALREGQEVVLVGLRGKLSSFIGHLGTIVKAKGGKDKFEVELRSGEKLPNEVLKIKGAEHLLTIVHVALPLPMGTLVVLCKLRNHLELNGCVGRVVECHDQGQRYEVRTEGGQLFRVKAENVVPVEASQALQALAKENQEPNTVTVTNSSHHESTASLSRPTAAVGSNAGAGTSLDGKGELLEAGCIVEIVGLKSNLMFNGEQAKVLVVDREKGRYEVRMSDGSIKKLKAENTRLVAMAPSSPLPRSPNLGAGYSPLLRYGNTAEHGKRKANDVSLRTPGTSVEKLPPATPDIHHGGHSVHETIRPGATVQLVGLRTQPHLNGQCALVLQDLGERAEIELEDKSVKKVRKDNIRVV